MLSLLCMLDLLPRACKAAETGFQEQASVLHLRCVWMGKRWLQMAEAVALFVCSPRRWSNRPRGCRGCRLRWLQDRPAVNS